MIEVEFTEQEIIALRQLLHRAVLHSGMDVAEAAVAITQKLVAASLRSKLAQSNGKAATETSDGLDTPQ